MGCGGSKEGVNQPGPEKAKVEEKRPEEKKKEERKHEEKKEAKVDAKPEAAVSTAGKSPLDPMITFKEFMQIGIDASFAAVDTKNTGKITLPMLRTYFETYGLSAAVLDEVMDHNYGRQDEYTKEHELIAPLGIYLLMPKDKGKLISKDNFVILKKNMCRIRDEKMTDAEILEAFKTNDTDNDGFIDIAQFHEAYNYIT